MTACALDPAGIHEVCYSMGGANGWVFVGAMEMLEQILACHGLRMVDQIHTAAGASVGSIFALTHALRMTARDTRNIAQHIVDHCRHLEFDVFAIGNKLGAAAMDPIRVMVQTLLTHRLGFWTSDMTLQQMYRATAVTLRVVAHNLSRGCNECLSWQTTPDLEVWRAICMSCSIPVVFQPQTWQGHVYTDGGVSSGFPIEQIDLAHGVAFHLRDEVPTVPAENMGLQDFLWRLVIAAHAQQQVKIDHLPAALRARVISVPVPGTTAAASGFQLEPDVIRTLIKRGQRAALNLFYPHVTRAIAVLTLFIRLSTLAGKHRRARQRTRRRHYSV